MKLHGQKKMLFKKKKKLATKREVKFVQSYRSPQASDAAAETHDTTKDQLSVYYYYYCTSSLHSYLFLIYLIYKAKM